QGDEVGPGILCAQRGLNRIRIGRMTLLAQGCHVIDIDTKFHHQTPEAGAAPAGAAGATGAAVASLACWAWGTVSRYQPPPSALYSSTRFINASMPVCRKLRWVAKRSTWAF